MRHRDTVAHHAFVLTRLMGSRLPRLQYGLWALVLIRLMIPVDLASSWSARSFLEKVPGEELSFTGIEDIERVESPVVLPGVAPSGTVPLVLGVISAWILGVAVSVVSFERKRRRCRGEIARSMAASRSCTEQGPTRAKTR